MCLSETQCPLLRRFEAIYLTFDLKGWPWPWLFTAQNVQLHEIHMHAQYQVAIFNIAKVMTNVKVFGRTDRLTDGQTDWRTVQKLYATLRRHKKVMANVKVFGQTDRCHISDIWPWMMTLTLTFHHSQCAGPWYTWKKECFWPLTLKDNLDPDLSPVKMCNSMRYTCKPNMNFLSSILQKLWPMLKFSDGQTDRRTDRQFKCYMPPFRGHKYMTMNDIVMTRTSSFMAIFDFWTPSVTLTLEIAT